MKIQRDMEVTCPRCGREFYADYEEGDDIVYVACPGCGELDVITPDDPGEWDRYGAQQRPAVVSDESEFIQAERLRIYDEE